MVLVEVLEVLGNICTIIGCIASLVAAGFSVRVYSSNRTAGGEAIQSGRDLTNTGALVNGSQNVEVNLAPKDVLPVLDRDSYKFPITDAGCSYASQTTFGDCCRKVSGRSFAESVFVLDFESVGSGVGEDAFVGYAYKNLPVADWRSFVNEGFVFRFAYRMLTGSMPKVEVEATTVVDGSPAKFVLGTFTPAGATQTFAVDLGQYSGVLESWRSVTEVCLVFRPSACAGCSGELVIDGMRIDRC